MLLVFGPRSPSYDFGPDHPLTPRRFGPGIDLLRSVGAEPGLAPEPAPDEELRWCHSARYVETVRRFSVDPYGLPEMGIAEGGDTPPFPGMHEAAAMVAGGSLRAVEAILRGDVEHAFHPGGGLHHAMRDRAAGFCIYDDPALAIARARRAGRRVLYVDLDVHHGDGVQALHADDPGVLTISFHETGRYLFPGTGFTHELGEGTAAGTSVNVPFEPGSGEAAWLPAVESLVPEMAAAFGPSLIVSQHGSDSHAWDPLAHLRVTTTAMGAAARLVDRVAHASAGGAWLATGGGGYDAYRVVPRAWTLTWLAGAHRGTPATTPPAWRERWAAEAARYGQAPLPATFEDEPNAGVALDASQEAAEGRSRRTVHAVRETVVPRLLREAADRGWWAPLGPDSGQASGAGDPSQASGAGDRSDARAMVLGSVDAAMWDRLSLAPRVIPPVDTESAHQLVMAALTNGARVSAAVDGGRVVGLALSRPSSTGPQNDLLALGVAPGARRNGLARALLDAHASVLRAERVGVDAVVTVAERDPFEPLDGGLRRSIARRLFERAGFTVTALGGDVGRADPAAVRATRSA